MTIEDFVTKGDDIVARLRWRSTTAASQVLERQTLDVLRIRDGRLAEHWGAPAEVPPEHYRPIDWIDPRIEIRPSSVHGRGMFARRQIAPGEIVTVWGGEFVLTEPDLLRKHALGMRCSLGTIGEGRYLAHILGESEEGLSNLLNHSCDPNLWLHDEVTLGARRDISSGEEITLDYAMIEDHEEWVGPFKCRCGSPFCRGHFTGKDWRREDLQERYSEHFSPFLNERFRLLRTEAG